MTGKSGDGGVDVKGVLRIPHLVKVDLVVQVKRYKDRIARTTTPLGSCAHRSRLVHAGQLSRHPAFRFDSHDVATETGSAHIGLIDGRQLVELLIEHWDGILQ